MAEPAGDATALERQVQEIFADALELPAAEREVWLASRCGGDAALEAAVLERLRLDEETVEKFAPLRLRGLLVGPGGAGEEVGGQRSYRLISELGQGGMGSVWLAERQGGEFRQRVAIKLLARERPELVQRFRTERQILASLDHPGIAKLLDGGSLPNGTPYLVMEHVDGIRIDEYCRRERLGVRARVELFLEVCAAVEAAHQRLIVHRDLKPGNILVNAEGRPKLLDFGIAKLLGHGHLDFTLAETRLGETPLTLRYASPEQVMGEPIGTTSDVYSLGVVLYELLAERSPYGLDSSLSTAALALRICQEEPPRPSTTVSAVAVAAGEDEAPRRHLQLEGDLDAIVLKALRKEPSGRYPGVAALAEDLRRYLDGWPVEARRGDRLYAAGKFVRRHRLALAAALLLFLTVTTAAVVSYRQARQLEAERDRVVAAEKLSRDKEAAARQVTKFLVEILQGADPEKNQGREPSVREVLDRGAERIHQELAGQPEVEAPLQEAIGAIFSRLVQIDRSRAAYQRAEELRRQRADTDPLALAECLSRRSLLEKSAGDYTKAEALSREALGLLEEAGGAESRGALREKMRLASVLVRQRRLDEAEPLLDQVLASELRSAGFAGLPLALDGREVDPAWEPLWDVLVERGHAANVRGNSKAARLYYGEALRIADGLFGPQHSKVAALLVSSIGPLLAEGAKLEALAAADRALAINTAVFGPKHPRLIMNLINRGAILASLGRWSEVFSISEEARQLSAAAQGENHPTTFAAEGNACEALANLGRREEALAYARRTLGRCLAHQPENDECRYVGWLSVGDLLLQLGRPGEARDPLEKAAAQARRLYGPEHPRRLRAEKLLAAAGG